MQIGTVTILQNENLAIVPDDRQTLVKIIGGVTVEDYGVCANGEAISVTVTLSDADWATVRGYWTNRTLVTVTLDDNTSFTGRVVVKNITYADKLLPRYKKITMELWRV